MPLVVVSIIGGALADAHDRRRQTLLTELGLMACSADSSPTRAFRIPIAGALYVIAALIAVLEGLQRPAEEAMVPRLVPREDLKAASASVRRA